MNTLKISLFGRFRAEYGSQALLDLEAHKLQELFCYLLLYRVQPHPRETLAGLLWPETSTAQSKKICANSSGNFKLPLRGTLNQALSPLC